MENDGNCIIIYEIEYKYAIAVHSYVTRNHYRHAAFKKDSVDIIINGRNMIVLQHLSVTECRMTHNKQRPMAILRGWSRGCCRHR